MKNIIKKIGIILILTLFVFSTITCDDSNNENNNQSLPTQIPNTPTGVSATASSTSSINVSWNSVNNATGYKIYYRISSSSTLPNGTETIINTTSTNRLITGLNSSTTYFIWVKATNSVGESGYSTRQSVTTQSQNNPPPATNGSLRIVNNSTRQITSMTLWKNKNTYDGITLFSYNFDYTLINSNSSLTISDIPAGYYGAGLSGTSPSGSFNITTPITITSGTTVTVTITNSNW